VKQRVISTVVLWGLVIGLLLLFKVYGGLLLILALSGLAQWETYGLLGRIGGSPQRRAGVLAGSVMIAMATLLALGCGESAASSYSVSFGLVFPFLVVFVMLRSPVHQLGVRLIPTLTGFLLVPCCLAFYGLLSTMGALKSSEGLFVAVWVVAVAKFSDVGALLVGRRFGRTPLTPTYSPKKTVEGAIGGVLTSALVACLLLFLFPSIAPDGLTLGIGFLLGFLFGAVAIVSDLLGSGLKRAAKVKDSGASIPGIGGGLDLVDSLLLTGPLAFAIFGLVL